MAFAKSGENQYRIGGYGYLLGDGGSGYAIGRAVIEAALRFEDGSGSETALYAPVLTKCGSKTVLEALGSFYRGGKSLIATYAPLLFDALEQELTVIFSCSNAVSCKKVGNCFFIPMGEQPPRI